WISITAVTVSSALVAKTMRSAAWLTGCTDEQNKPPQAYAEGAAASIAASAAVTEKLKLERRIGRPLALRETDGRIRLAQLSGSPHWLTLTRAERGAGSAEANKGGETHSFAVY